MVKDRRRFWKNLKKSKNWNRPSLFKKGSHPGLPALSSEIFSAIVAASNHLRSDPRNPITEIRFYGNGKLFLDPKKYLPTEKDKNFLGWKKRIKKTFKEFVLITNRLEYFFSKDLPGVRSFVFDMVEGLGYPSGSADLTLFAGCYSKTPFGVHTDPEVNFYWPIIGPKRMVFWSPKYGDRALASIPVESRKEYKSHMPKSIVLNGKPGDMMAWPGTWWHVGESPVFNLSFTIPLYFFTQTGSDYDRQKRQLVDYLLQVSGVTKGETLVPGTLKKDGSVTIPPFVSDAAKILNKLYTPDDLKEASIEQWISTVSRAGLKYQRKIDTNKKIVLNYDSVFKASGLLYWGDLGHRRICVAYEGNSIVLPKSPALLRLLVKINDLRPHSYQSLKEAWVGKSDEFNEILGKLIELEAISENGQIAA